MTTLCYSESIACRHSDKALSQNLGLLVSATNSRNILSRLMDGFSQRLQGLLTSGFFRYKRSPSLKAGLRASLREVENVN